MSGSRGQLKGLFFAALECAPAERRAFLDAVADSGLRQELQALLDAHDAAGEFLEAAPPRAPIPTLAQGRFLGPYEVLDLIGKGGMGEVYRARDPRLGREVAIKVMPAATGADQSWQKRFADEARAASALNHPNVLTVYDVGTVDDGTNAPFIVMELLSGKTLRSVLEADGTLPADVAANYGLQVARGLGAAHAAGIIHRDIKPENLFVTDDGRVKILDFGIAKFGRAANHFTAATATAPGAVVGTAAYMSPEQVRGQPADERSDIFSLGVVLFEVLTGKQAFGRDSAIETLSAILHADPIDPKVTSFAGAPWLVAVIRRCLAKAPEDRFPNAAELAGALEQAPGSVVKPRSRMLPMVAAAIGAVAIIGIGAAMWQGRSTTVSTSAAPRVLAVMPFENISADKTQQYFVDGMTEEINAHLARLSTIRLMSRAAMTRYRTLDDVPRRLKEDLGVSALVTGSVRLAGDRAKISVHLVDTTTAQSLWTQQYERTVNDILQLQSEVASQIASAMQAQISADDQRRIARQSTTNPAAYEMFLKAAGMRTGPQRVEILKEAVALDPNFAVAHAALSRIQGELGEFGDRRLFDDALASARRAVAADPNEARAHHALATILMRMGRLSEARDGYRRALDLAPNMAEAAWDLSISVYAGGRFDEALTWARRGFVLAPNVSTAYYHVAVPLNSLADSAAAGRWLRGAEERFPRAPRIQYMIADIEFQSGREQEADARVRRALVAAPDNPELKAIVAAYSFLMGAPDAPARIEELFKESPTARTYSMPASFRALKGYLLVKRGETAAGNLLLEEALAAARAAASNGIEAVEEQLEIAAILAFRGDAKGSIEALRAAYRGGDRFYRELQRDPFFETLRSHPEFVAIVRDMEADVAAQRKRIDVSDNPPLPPIPPTPTPTPPAATLTPPARSGASGS